MGQKVNPIGIRLGITRDWSSKWYAGSKTFASNIHTDFLVRQYLTKKLADASVSRIHIERALLANPHGNSDEQTPLVILTWRGSGPNPLRSAA